MATATTGRRKPKVSGAVLDRFRSARAYIESFLWIVPEEGGAEIPLILNEPQLHVRREKARARRRGRPLRFLIPKFRKGGVTTQEQADSFSLTANFSNVQAVTFADESKKTEEIFRISTRFYDSLDPRIRPARARSNKRVLLFPELGSQFFIGTAGSPNALRGLSIQRFHGSEVPLWLPGRSPDEMENLIAGIKEACRVGEITLEGTSRGNSGWWYDTIMEAITVGNEWTVIFLPWWIDPTLRIAPIDEEEEAEILETTDDRLRWLIDEKGLDASQVKWRETTFPTLGRLALQEYPEILEESFVGGDLAFFDARNLNDLRQRIALAKRGPSEGWGWWEEPDPQGDYIFGVDTSTGEREGDFAAVAVLNRRKRSQAARWHGKLRPKRLAKMIATEAGRWNRALVAVERQFPGNEVLAFLAEVERYPNLYVSLEAAEKKGTSLRKRRLGWSTDSGSRPIMLDDLREAMETSALVVNDRAFLAECATFEKNLRTGKYEARSGKNDDLIVAWAIAWGVHQDGGGVRPGIAI